MPHDDVPGSAGGTWCWLPAPRRFDSAGGSSTKGEPTHDGHTIRRLATTTARRSRHGRTGLGTFTGSPVVDKPGLTLRSVGSRATIDGGGANPTPHRREQLLGEFGWALRDPEQRRRRGRPASVWRKRGGPRYGGRERRRGRGGLRSLRDEFAVRDGPVISGPAYRRESSGFRWRGGRGISSAWTYGVHTYAVPDPLESR